jgi:hypothetical protein
MKQSINLLKDLPSWEKEQYPFNFYLGINIVLILLLVIFYGLFYYEYQTKNNIINGMLYQYNAATEQLSLLQNKVIASGKNEKVNAEYQTFLYNLYKKNADNGTTKLYTILDSLGAQINSGIWLNQIDLENFGSEISLTGFALQPQNAMTYVSALNTLTAFKNSVMKLEYIKNVSQKSYLFIKIASQKSASTDDSKVKTT